MTPLAALRLLPNNLKAQRVSTLAIIAEGYKSCGDSKAAEAALTELERSLSPDRVNLYRDVVRVARMHVEHSDLVRPAC